MAQIKDSTRSTLADHSIDLKVVQKNFKMLEPEEARMHLEMLALMLAKMSKLVARKLPRDGGNNPEFLNYLHRLNSTLDAFVLKNRYESLKPNSDIRLSCTIDPSDSGFPIFVRDFKFLATDKNNTAAELAKLPENGQLVDDALYLLFRGLYPKDVILQKLARDYYETLTNLSLPAPLAIYPETHIKEDDRFNYCKQSFERLDEHHNIPRFYTLYLKIPSKSYWRPEWKDEIRQMIPEGLSTVANLELGYLVKRIEDIEGVQVEYVERFDIGPFYNRYTENTGSISSLIDSENEYVMMFRKYTVVRAGEEERIGLKERLKGWRSGDAHIGKFSPAIASPQYILMPHRLIQKVHNLNLDIENVRMYELTGTGDIHD